MTLVRGVVDRFLRRSGSRVSILNACRHQVPTWTLSLRVIPIPSRTTQQSTRPRASDRSMCCQPGNRHGLPASETDRRSHYSTRMQLRWNHARSANIPTPPLTHGAGRQGNTFSFRSREKNVLDISSYRSGVLASLRFLFAKIRVNECYRDISQVAPQALPKVSLVRSFARDYHVGTVCNCV